MGYRSEVGYVIMFQDNKLGKEMFYTFLAEAKAKSETNLCFTEHNPIQVDEDRLRLVFGASDVKWYDGDADVDCHEALIAMAKEYCDQEETRANEVNTRERVKYDAKYGHMTWDERELQGIAMFMYEQENIGYAYVRIGEEADDCDQKFGGWDEAQNIVQLSRVIDFNLE
jgi:hypothetical protein